MFTQQQQQESAGKEKPENEMKKSQVDNGEVRDMVT